jgi:hypothetical protein
MRNRFCLILLIVFFAVVGFMVPVQADEGTPVVVIENGSFDFGSVYEGVDVVHDFIIQNKGDADLEVTNVKAG